MNQMKEIKALIKLCKKERVRVIKVGDILIEFSDKNIHAPDSKGLGRKPDSSGNNETKSKSLLAEGTPASGQDDEALYWSAE